MPRKKCVVDAEKEEEASAPTKRSTRSTRSTRQVKAKAKTKTKAKAKRKTKTKRKTKKPIPHTTPSSPQTVRTADVAVATPSPIRLQASPQCSPTEALALPTPTSTPPASPQPLPTGAQIAPASPLVRSEPNESNFAFEDNPLVEDEPLLVPQPVVTSEPTDHHHRHHHNDKAPNTWSSNSPTHSPYNSLDEHELDNALDDEESNMGTEENIHADNVGRRLEFPPSGFDTADCTHTATTERMVNTVTSTMLGRPLQAPTTGDVQFADVAAMNLDNNMRLKDVKIPWQEWYHIYKWEYVAFRSILDKFIALNYTYMRSDGKNKTNGQKIRVAAFDIEKRITRMRKITKIISDSQPVRPRDKGKSKSKTTREGSKERRNEDRDDMPTEGGEDEDDRINDMTADAWSDSNMPEGGSRRRKRSYVEIEDPEGDPVERPFKRSRTQPLQ